MTEAEAIEAFLADRDVPCPDCGYNLRGSRRPFCPECGLGIALYLGRSSSPEIDPEVEAAHLREFLQTHDAFCPRCREALRGYEGVACPRCRLRLSVWTLKPTGLPTGMGGRIVVWYCLAAVVVTLLLLYRAVQMY